MYALRRHAGFIAFMGVALVLILVPSPAHALFNEIGNILTTVIQWLIELLGNLLLFITDVFLLPIAQYNGFLQSDAVNAGWQVVRDLTNMFFVVMMLVIAFGTILSIEEFSFHALLPRLLIMAILINFSKVIAGLFIDFSQVVMLTFVNGFAAAAGANMLNLLQVRNIFNVSPSGFEALSPGDILGSLFLGLAMIGIGLVIVILMTGMLAMRIVMLWALLILSPIAFFLSSFPRGRAKEAYSKWWSMFGNYLTAGPVLAFFLWIAFYTAGSGSLAKSEAFPVSITDQEKATIEGITESKVGQQFFASEAGSEASMVSFIIGIALLMAGMMITQEFSVMGGSALSGAASWMQSRGGAFLKGTAAAPARLAWTSLKYGERKLARATGIGLNPMRYIEGFKASREVQKKEDEAEIRAHSRVAALEGGVFAPIKTFVSNPEEWFRKYFSPKGMKLAFSTMAAPQQTKHYVKKAEAVGSLAEKDEKHAEDLKKGIFSDEEINEKVLALARARGKTESDVAGDQKLHEELWAHAVDELDAEAPETAKRLLENAQVRRAEQKDWMDKARLSRAPSDVLGAAAERALEAEARKSLAESGETAETQIVLVKDALELGKKHQFKVAYKRMIADGNIDDIMLDLGFDVSLEGAKEMAEKILKTKLHMTDEEIMNFMEEVQGLAAGKRPAFAGLIQRDPQSGQIRWSSQAEQYSEWEKQTNNIGAKRVFTQGNRHMLGYDRADDKKFHPALPGANFILQNLDEFESRVKTGKEVRGKMMIEILSAQKEWNDLLDEAEQGGFYGAEKVKRARDAIAAGVKRLEEATREGRTQRAERWIVYQEEQAKKKKAA